MSSAGQSNSGGGVNAFLSGMPVPTTITSSKQYPLWLQSAMSAAASAAGNLAQQPFAQFPGPTVAAPSAQTTQAQQLAGQNVGAWQPDLAQAGALTAAAGAPITSSDISTFLNPYQDYITGALNRNLNENVLPGVQDKFVSAGQSRSPQEAEITNRAMRDNQIAVGQSLAGAYQGALNSLQQQRAQMGSSGAAFGQLGALNSQLGAVDVGQLAAAGNAQDQLGQANINAALNSFNAQQEDPYKKLSYLTSTLQGLPTSGLNTTSTQTQTGTNFAPSPLATFAGTLGVGNSMGTAAAPGHARGGRIKKMAMGGLMPGGMAPQPGVGALNEDATAVLTGPDSVASGAPPKQQPMTLQMAPQSPMTSIPQLRRGGRVHGGALSHYRMAA